MSIVWTRNDLRARVTGRYTGEATDPFMTSIDDTFTIDLSAQWDLSDRWALEARPLTVYENNQKCLILQHCEQNDPTKRGYSM